MTKKDFIKLADALRGKKPNIDPKDFESPTLAQWHEDCDAIADLCAQDNPRFKRERWFDYINGICGPNGGKL